MMTKVNVIEKVLNLIDLNGNGVSFTNVWDSPFLGSKELESGARANRHFHQIQMCGIRSFV